MIYTVMTLFVLGALFLSVSALVIWLTWPRTFADTERRRE